jgi:hypothetical protein
MRCDLTEPSRCGVVSDQVIDCLFTHALSNRTIALVDVPKQYPFCESRNTCVLVYGLLGPGRHRHRADLISLADDVDENLASISLLNAIEC